MKSLLSHKICHLFVIYYFSDLNETRNMLLKVLRVNVSIVSLLRSRCAGIYSFLIIFFGYNNVYDSSYASQPSTAISRTLCSLI